MRHLILPLLLFLVAAAPANSDCAVRRRAVVHQAVVEAAAVVATPVVATTFVPIAVPTYGVSYVGGDPTEIAKLNEKIDRLEKLLAQLAGPVPNAAAPAPKAEPTATDKAVALVQAKCAQCHTANKNPKKGFEIFTFDGKLTPSAKLLGVVYRGKTADGKVMPPSGQSFTDEEVAVILDGLGR